MDWEAAYCSQRGAGVILYEPQRAQRDAEILLPYLRVLCVLCGAALLNFYISTAMAALHQHNNSFNDSNITPPAHDAQQPPSISRHRSVLPMPYLTIPDAQDPIDQWISQFEVRY